VIVIRVFVRSDNQGPNSTYNYYETDTSLKINDCEMIQIVNIG